MVSSVNQSEIVFFDLETTIPTYLGQPYAILEFGSIIVCPRKLIHLDMYETLVRPDDLSLITASSIRSNGITADAVVSAPTFSDIAERVYGILHGRIWGGHNIMRFDCVRLREAYAQINRPPPEPKGIIDTLPLLRQTFGSRAGNMKMASLCSYFGLGQQSHRSLEDVRMNIEVLKNCATVLFLESIQPADVFTQMNSVSPNANPPTSTSNSENNHTSLTNHALTSGPVQQVPTPVESLQSNEAMVAESSSTTTLSNTFSPCTDFVEPDGVSMASITVVVSPFLHGPPRIQILHRDIPMQIHCNGMRIRFGLSTKFVDHAGRPRLSFLVDANSSVLCGVLDACDNIVKRFVDSDSNSEWRPVVCRKPGFYDSPTIRLHITTVAEDNSRWITEIYHEESSVACSTLEALFCPGCLVDAYFSLDPYNYQQNAGIRLVAKKLIVHPN